MLFIRDDEVSTWERRHCSELPEPLGKASPAHFVRRENPTGSLAATGNSLRNLLEAIPWRKLPPGILMIQHLFARQPEASRPSFTWLASLMTSSSFILF